MVAGKRRPAAPTLFDLEEPAPPAPRWPGLVRVALDRPLRTAFTYGVPEEALRSVRPGMRVAVTFARRRCVGVVVDVPTSTDVSPARLQPILEVLDREPVVEDELLGLTRWIAERTACSWGEALAAVLPAALKRESRGRRIAMLSVPEGVGRAELAELETASPKQHRLLRELLACGEPVEMRAFLRRLNLSDSPARTLARRGLVRIEQVEHLADPLAGAAQGVRHRERPATLSDAQAAACTAIEASLAAREHATFLLEGVTGSGKTEVYLRAIEAALAQGRAAVVLVPEIALTPQTVSWFRSRFGRVCVLHSALTDAQRLASWRQLRAGEVRVVVGARSAIFAPLADLGVVVVDEEHEPSFKQESVPRYHARDVAVERARRAGAVCILGSATPSLESWSAARAGTYRTLRLPERVGGGTPPQVHVVDMRRESVRGKGTPLFSRLLGALLKETVEAGEQAILFLNRRGFVPVLYCPGCEETLRCDQCDMGWTYHRRIKRLVCHSCCAERGVPSACPICSRPGLRFLGVGAERVESELAEFLPGVRVRRMDSDTMRRREDYDEALAAFERREVDVLVGTQMIAKGLDFPGVTLVGIVSADSGLHLPDFRATERTFQLIAQVAGRAGRSHLPGRIVVQTLVPDHAAIRFGASADHAGFAAHEAPLREALGYPPFGRLLRVVIEDDEEARVTAEGEALARALRAEPFAATLAVLGPAPAPMALLRGRHRAHVLLKCAPDDTAFARAVDWLAERAARTTRPRLKLDVDPMSLM